MRFWAYSADLLIVFAVNGILLSPLAFFNAGSVSLLEFFTIQGLLSGLVMYLYFLIMTKNNRADAWKNDFRTQSSAKRHAASPLE